MPDAKHVITFCIGHLCIISCSLLQLNTLLHHNRIECCALLGRYRLYRGRLHFQRINGLTILPYSKVQMRPGTGPRTSHIAYHIALFHTTTHLNTGTILREMQVSRTIDRKSVVQGKRVGYSLRHGVASSE